MCGTFRIMCANRPTSICCVLVLLEHAKPQLMPRCHHASGMAAARAKDVGHTTLGAAVAAVPQLGEACSLVLTYDRPGSGLKVMRLVCKDLCTAMLGVVRGYSLHLDGRAAGLENQITLLESTRLTHLCVAVFADREGKKRRQSIIAEILGAHIQISLQAGLQEPVLGPFLVCIQTNAWKNECSPHSGFDDNEKPASAVTISTKHEDTARCLIPFIASENNFLQS